MSYSKDESKLDREAREERLGGVFWIDKDENGNEIWPDHWTNVEIKNFYEYQLELARKYD